MTSLKILSEKINNVKDKALEKENRDDLKMAGILNRLDSIERKMSKDKYKSEENALERANQKDSTTKFKEADGLVDIEAGDRQRKDLE